jgi:hypothetical protein
VLFELERERDIIGASPGALIFIFFYVYVLSLNLVSMTRILPSSFSHSLSSDFEILIKINIRNQVALFKTPATPPPFKKKTRRFISGVFPNRKKKKK